MESFKSFLNEKIQAVINTRRDLIRHLERNGFTRIRSEGHKTYGHPSGLTIAVPHSDTFSPGVTRAILKVVERANSMRSQTAA